MPFALNLGTSAMMSSQDSGGFTPTRSKSFLL